MWAVGHNHCIACTCGMSTVAINIYSALLYTVSVTTNDRPAGLGKNKFEINDNAN